MDAVDPTVPAHLRPLLGAAAEHELEAITDHEWPTEPDERATRRTAVIDAALVAGRWPGGGISRAEIARLAERAAADQQPSDFIGVWPASIAQADELIRRTGLTRDLLQLRDALTGQSA